MRAVLVCATTIVKLFTQGIQANHDVAGNQLVPKTKTIDRTNPWFLNVPYIVITGCTGLDNISRFDTMSTIDTQHDRSH